jgi:signal recognition particle subunit SRP54
MFESLQDKLDAALQNVKGQGRINELNIAETMREVRRALLDADVNYQVARDFTNRVKDQASDEKVLSAVSPGQQFIKILHDELVFLLGDVHVELNKGKRRRR